MIIKENKRKKVFSKKKDIDANRFNLDPEYLGFEEYLAGDDTSVQGNQIIHKFNIKIPIDRLAAVNNDFAYIDAYLIRDPSIIKSRKKMMSGFNSSKKSNLNFAVINKELLARNEIKAKEIDALTYSLFSVGIVHSVLLGLTKDKIKNLPEEEVFGYEETIEAYKMVNTNSANKNNLDIEFTNFNQNVRNDKSFKPQNYDIYKQSINPTNTDVFKKEYIKTRIAGIDPAVVINAGQYNTQSLVDTIKGRLPEKFRYKKNIQLLENYNNIIESKIISNKKTITVIKKKKSKRHQVFEKVIKITDKTLAALSNNISVIVYAKDKNKRKIDSYFFNYSFNELKSRYLLTKALSSYEGININSSRKNNKVTLSLANKSNFKVEFNIKRAVFKRYEGIHNIKFKDFTKNTVSPNSKRRAALAKDSCLKHQSIFYRANFEINGFKIDNTMFVNSPSIVSNSNNMTTIVGITAENTNVNRVILHATNIPQTALGINIVKRNISKKERNFKIIKTFNSLGSVIDLFDHRPIFFKKTKDKKSEFRFIDDDVEESAIYEYKIVSYLDNGEILKSCNSLIHEFEKKRGLVQISLLDSSKENIENQIREGQFASLGYRFKVDFQKNAIMEMFESLDRNTFELLSVDLEDIKNSLTQNTSCIVYLENIDNTTLKEIQRVTPDKDGLIDIYLNLGNLFDRQNLVIEPRVKTSTGLIDNILEKIESLPTVEKNNLSTSFLKNLRLFKQKYQKNEKNYVSKIGEKYTSRSVKLLGTINDPVTKFNQEGVDLYRDGRTGDIVKIRLPSKSLLERTGTLKLINFLTSYDKNNNKIKMLISMISKNSEFVDFYSVYTLSNGSLSFKGLISASDKSSGDYSFYLDLKNETGLVEIFAAAVAKDGTIISPTQIGSFIVEKNNVRKI